MKMGGDGWFGDKSGGGPNQLFKVMPLFWIFFLHKPPAGFSQKPLEEQQLWVIQSQVREQSPRYMYIT